MKTPQLISIVALLGLSLGVGYAFYEKQHQEPSESKAPAQMEMLDHLPAFSYPDIQGNERSSAEWQNKIVVLNFWATWCPPCRKEMPVFIEIQAKNPENVQFVGIAIDDKDAVVQFADMMGINYPTLLGDMNAISLSKQLGNRFSGLPFTAIFDNSGKLVSRHSGELTREELENQLKKLL